MHELTPIYTASLFPELHAELMGVLRRLGDDDWLRPTPAGSWRVRDVAAHLLDVDLRKLATSRDGYHPSADATISSFADIVGLINRQNAEAVEYGKRLSPRLLTDLLDITGQWVSELVAALEPHAEAYFAVTWAGEHHSENWMDTGREYTERWHHQMQIRDALGIAGLLERRWLYPLLDLSVRAFPRAYEGVEAEIGTTIVFEVESKDECAWSVVREESGWQVWRGRAPRATTSLRTDRETAWRLLYNALSPEAASARVSIHGDRQFAEPMLSARSVMV